MYRTAYQFGGLHSRRFPRATNLPNGWKFIVGARCLNSRQQKGGQRSNQVTKSWRFQTVLSQKCLPLRLFLEILRKCVSETEGSLPC